MYTTFLLLFHELIILHFRYLFVFKAVMAFYKRSGDIVAKGSGTKSRVIMVLPLILIFRNLRYKLT